MPIESLPQVQDPLVQDPELLKPLLVSAKAAAALCARTERCWRTWDRLGIIPKPKRLGRSTLWDRRELEDWVAGGCPKRDAWEAARKCQNTGRRDGAK